MFVDFVTPFDTSLTELYDLSSIKLLTPETEHELAVRYKETGDIEAAHSLTLSHLPYVVNMASRYAAYFRMSVRDLIHEGLIGLMKALKSFDPYRECRFISLARWWVVREIKEYIYRCSKELRIGTTAAQRRLFFRVGELQNQSLVPYEQRVEAMAKELNVTTDEVNSMVQRLSAKHVSLDAWVGSETETPFSNMIPDMAPTPEESLIEKDRVFKIKKLIHKGLSTLTESEIIVLQGRYFNDKPLTCRELGERMGVSKQRVNELEIRALKKLKTALSGCFNFKELAE